MGEALQKERRRFPRVQRVWFVRYTSQKTPSEDWAMGQVKDLSVGGVCFWTTEDLEVKMKLKMRFSFPVLALRLIQGTVVWRREVRPHQYEYGVAFEPPSPDEAKVLQQYLTKLSS